MNEASPQEGRKPATSRWLGVLPARWRDDRGAAAVEFAIILPVMLALYLSTAVTTKAYMATRKVALVARALADIASRQATGTTANCTPSNSNNACVGNADMANFFAAAATIMAPYTSSTLKMTLSRIDVVKDSSNKMWAFTKWSVTNNSGVARPCNGGNSTFTPPGSPTLTNGSTYPLRAGDVGLTTSGAPTGYLIVADVTYTYTPGFSFKVFNWSNLTTINTGWSQAFWSRTGQPIEGTSLTTNATVCSQNTPSSP